MSKVLQLFIVFNRVCLFVCSLGGGLCTGQPRPLLYSTLAQSPVQSLYRTCSNLLNFDLTIQIPPDMLKFVQLTPHYTGRGHVQICLL